VVLEHPALAWLRSLTVEIHPDLMKLHDASNSAQHAFTGYGDGYVVIDAVTYRSSLIVTPSAVDDSWAARSSATLDASTLAPLEQFRDCIILLGTGSRQQFPAPALLRSLASKGIAVEVMDNFAACRTFNILAAEGRPVVAALLIGGANA
jgi:uncharacterized protein